MGRVSSPSAIARKRTQHLLQRYKEGDRTARDLLALAYEAGVRDAGTAIVARPSPSPAIVKEAGEVDWTGGRAWPDLLEAVAQYWAQWEGERACGTMTAEELAEDGGNFATGLADHLAALSASNAAQVSK